MYNIRRIIYSNKTLFASVAVTTSGLTVTRSHSYCHDHVWNHHGLRLPKFASISPSTLDNSVNHELASYKENLKMLNQDIGEVSEKYPTTVVNALEKIRMPLYKDWGLVGHLVSVKNSDEIRATQKTLQEKVVMATQELGQSKDVYDGLLKVKNNSTVWEHMLDESQRRIISDKLLDMQHSGVALPSDKREQFNALQLEAVDLSSKFKNNLLDSTKAFQYVIKDVKDMEGVPAGSKSLFSARAVAAGHKEATAEAGPWVVTLDIPSYLACMQHVRNRKVREAVYRGYVQRASEFSTGGNGTGEFDNTKIIERLLEIRYEMSRMLGYNNYAEQSLATKMAGSIPVVMNMIQDLREASIAAAKKDLAEVEEHAKKNCNFDGAKLELWDIPFYTERLREDKYGYKEEELKVYFALDNVLSGLFSLAGKLFGVSIDSVPTTVLTKEQGDAVSPSDEVEVWHKDVRFFTVKDSKSGNLLAAFYLDPYSRPENKSGGAWMNVCLQRSKLFNQTPVAYLICNSAPPSGDGKPALMTFREVETLFHEFGHGLQHMLTTVPYGEASGIANIEWDAVELPSQFMENWCYDTDTLLKFARHYETNEPIPEVYMNKLKASKNYQSGYQMLRQLYFGALDMTLHSVEPRNNAGWIYDVQKEIAEKYTVVPPLAEDRFLNGFGHIFAGGYAAGYYSYKWAEVMSADAFGAFEEVGLENTAAVEDLGRKFRSTVLASGGGKHPSDVYSSFRGRAPSTDALLRHSGLTTK